MIEEFPLLVASAGAKFPATDTEANVLPAILSEFCYGRGHRQEDKLKWSVSYKLIELENGLGSIVVEFRPIGVYGV